MGGFTQGRYLAEVMGGVLTTSSNKGTEQIAVTFKLREGPDEGRQIVAYLALTDARLPYTVKELRTMGWGDDLADLATIQGAEVDLTIEDDTYNGRTRSKIAFINPPGSGGVKAAPPEKAQSIAERWRSKIAALPKDAASDPFGD